MKMKTKIINLYYKKIILFVFSSLFILSYILIHFTEAFLGEQSFLGAVDGERDEMLVKFD